MAESDPIGAQIFIGPATAAATSSAYAALTYVQIKDVETIPQFGRSQTVTKFTPLETGITKKKKGSIDNGDPEIVCFMDNLDPGQIAAIAASLVKSEYAFKVVLPDAATPSSANSIWYFHAVVSASNVEPGAADNIPRRRFGLGISGPIVTVPTT